MEIDTLNISEALDQPDSLDDTGAAAVLKIYYAGDHTLDIDLIAATSLCRLISANQEFSNVSNSSTDTSGDTIMKWDNTRMWNPDVVKLWRDFIQQQYRYDGEKSISMNPLSSVAVSSSDFKSCLRNHFSTTLRPPRLYIEWLCEFAVQPILRVNENVAYQLLELADYTDCPSLFDFMTIWIACRFYDKSPNEIFQSLQGGSSASGDGEDQNSAMISGHVNFLNCLRSCNKI